MGETNFRSEMKQPLSFNSCLSVNGAINASSGCGYFARRLSERYRRVARSVFNGFILFHNARCIASQGLHFDTRNAHRSRRMRLVTLPVNDSRKRAKRGFEIRTRPRHRFCSLRGLQLNHFAVYNSEITNFN